MTRIADPQINFADIEFLIQGIDLDPILKRMSGFLDEQPSKPSVVSGIRIALLGGAAQEPALA